MLLTKMTLISYIWDKC